MWLLKNRADIYKREKMKEKEQKRKVDKKYSAIVIDKLPNKIRIHFGMN